MEPTTEDRDFLRFRDAGDAEALARVFDALAPRLLLVAGHLACDWSRAEDLVQETFLEAMRGAGRWDPARPLAPWLAGILARRAADLRRREARGAAVLARVSAGEAAADGDAEAAAEVEETVARVAGAVEGLEEPYRRVLLLRLLHGLEPREIAHALGRSPGTVRMQLQRGREQLRGRLPASLAPALVVLEPGRGLAAVRATVLGSIGATAVPVASGGATLLAGSGVLALAAGVAGLVALALVLGWPKEERAPAIGVLANAEAARPLATELESPPRAEPAVAESRSSIATAAGSEVAPPASPGSLLVRVRHAASGAPASNVGVYVRAFAGGSLGLEQRTDEAGVARFVGLERGAFAVHLDRGGEQRVEVDGAVTLELALRAGVHVVGRVVDQGGNPVAGAAVHRLNPGHHDFLQVLARTDASGSFELEEVAPGTELVARAEGWQPSQPGARSSVRGAPGERAELELELGSRGHGLRGRVVDPRGKGVPRALVGIAVDEDARELEEGEAPRAFEAGGKAPDLEAFFVRADDEGRFESREVPRGRTTLLARPIDPGSERVAWLVLEVTGEGTPPVELRLREGAAVEGQVRDERGRARSGLFVELEWEGSFELGQVEDDLGPLGFDRRVEADGGGRFRAGGLLPGDYDLRVRTPEGVELARDERVLLAGETARWDALVDGVRQVVRVLDPEGRPLPDWSVSAHPLDEEGQVRAARLQDSVRTGADGRALFERLEPRLHRIAAHPPSAREGFHTLPAAVRDGVMPSSNELELRLRGDELPLAALRGVWVDAAGAPIAGGDLRLGVDWLRDGASARTDEQGRFAFEALAAGELELRARGGGYPRDASLGRWTLAPGEQRGVGRVALPDPAWLVLRLTVEGGAADRPHAELHDGDGRVHQLVRDEERGRLVSPPLWPGRYTLVATARDMAPLVQPIELEGPGLHERAADGQRGLAVTIDASVPAELVGGRQRMHVAVSSPEGLRLHSSRAEVQASSEGRVELELRLAPGRYRLELEFHPSASEARPSAALEIEVREGMAPVPALLR